MLLYFLLLIPNLSTGMDIIESPDENVWVEQGKDTSLVCTTEERWQWCYWEHQIMDNNTKGRYQVVQEYITMETVDPQIKYTQLSETTCGIQILDANPKMHQVKI